MDKDAYKEFNGGVTAENVEQWKKQHGKVFCIEVEDGDDLHKGYFRRPSIDIMAAVTKLSKTDEVKSGKTLFDGCWLGGSEPLRQDIVLFLTCLQQLNVLLTSATGRVKNL